MNVDVDSGMAEFFNFSDASLPVAPHENLGLQMAIPNLSGFGDEQW
jgi:hypothetical protein